MEMPKKLLCPTDFSDNSLRALRYAVELAHMMKAKIELLHVYHLPAHTSDSNAPMSVEQIDREVRTEIERSLRDMAAEVGDEARGIDVTFSVEVGVPYEKIAEHANHGDADLVVMAALGRSGISRLFLGNVTERVLRLCAKPVVTVPRDAKPL